MLDFVREMSLGSEDFTQRQSDYWIFVLQDYPSPFIERAFHQWVKQSKHMPVPSEIIAMLDAMIEAERQDGVAKETKRYLAEMQATRRLLAEAGQPHGETQYYELMKKACEVVQGFPSLPDPNRVPRLQQRWKQIQQERTGRKPVANAEPASVTVEQAG
jgi:hypothetical protein